MLPAGDHWPHVDIRTLDMMTQGNASLESAGEESPSSHDAAVPTDLITSQPVSMVDVSPSQGPPVKIQVSRHTPRGDVHKPCCPRCGCSVSPRHSIPPVHPALGRLQGSSLSVQSGSSSKRTDRSQDSLAGSQIAAATQDAGSCMHLVVACLWCQCSALLLALLEGCSSSLHALCSSCCRGCARCCATLQDAPVEDALRCHQQCQSVLFEACSCCESKECMEFCLDCCDVCHHS